ncbi:50S ribosomal protein L4 [Candidatus Woesearchaeota archaeon]|jgi:large subunit ribosomal protein L4e|nr:50S ribosomal protein L4 [Candidatus Woesearchaeota archaeon]|tara:strand:- start:423 stop:1220 length:798 start_codon:yes stop_codon:yes gene_type:complete
MKLKILNLNNTETKSVDLPNQFFEPVRTDLIHRAFLITQSNKKQPYGSDPEAGKKYSSELSRRRKKYRGSYGQGISRVPRKILSSRGTRFSWVGATMPGTVGGRRAHPPKVEKKLSDKINIKERRKAIRSAMAATIDEKFVKARGHFIPVNYPFVLTDKIGEINKTKKLKQVLIKLGFEKELIRSDEKGSVGLLLVCVEKEENTLKKAINNLNGFEVVNVKKLGVEQLAPGGVPGRLTVFTEMAFLKLKNEKLFTQNYVFSEKQN